MERDGQIDGMQKLYLLGLRPMCSKVMPEKSLMGAFFLRMVYVPEDKSTFSIEEQDDTICAMEVNEHGRRLIFEIKPEGLSSISIVDSSKQCKEIGLNNYGELRAEDFRRSVTLLLPWIKSRHQGKKADLPEEIKELILEVVPAAETFF
jgi:hypothetical protein